jgi:hypothetical protein
MCMKPIHSVDASFRRVLDVIQVQMAPHKGNAEWGGGRTQVNSQNGLDRYSFFWMLKFAGVWS